MGQTQFRDRITTLILRIKRSYFINIKKNARKSLNLVLFESTKKEVIFGFFFDSSSIFVRLML